MSAEDTANQEGGAAPTDETAGATTDPKPTDDTAADAGADAETKASTETAGDAGTAETGTPAVKPAPSEEHVAAAHAALHNLARDFKQLGIDFEAASCAAWEAQFDDGDE